MSKPSRSARVVAIAMLLGVQFDSQTASGQTSCDTVVASHYHYYCGDSCGNPKLQAEWKERWRWILCDNGFEDEWLTDPNYDCGCDGGKGGGKGGGGEN